MCNKSATVGECAHGPEVGASARLDCVQGRAREPDDLASAAAAFQPIDFLCRVTGLLRPRTRRLSISTTTEKAMAK